jgi:hypothetical protein
MRLTMRAKGKWTGHTHTLMSEKVKDSAVTLLPTGSVVLTMPIGPITTSGKFIGSLEFPLSELYLLLGIIEEKKLKQIVNNDTDLKAIKLAAKKAAEGS